MANSVPERRSRAKALGLRPVLLLDPLERLCAEVSGSLDSCPAMSAPELDEFRRLEQSVHVLRRGRPVNPETRRYNKCVAEGLRVTGGVIRWMRTGER